MNTIEQVPIKFGGFSNATGEAIQTSYEQSQNNIMVVASAPGSLSLEQIENAAEYMRDIPPEIFGDKITDQLLDAHTSFMNKGEVSSVYLRSIQARYEMIVDQLGLGNLKGSWLKSIPERITSAVHAGEEQASILGELLVMDIWSELGLTPLDPATAGINLAQSPYQWRRWLKNLDRKDGHRYFLPGNITYDLSRRKTFGRGGSDISASLAGIGIKAPYVINSSNTILQTIAPKYVPDDAHRKNVTDITYIEGRELGVNGTGIVHPDALTLLMGTGICTVLTNTFDPEGPQTIYSDEPQNPHRRGLPTAMSVMEDVAVISVHEPGMSSVPGRVGALSLILARHGVNSIDVQSGGTDSEKFIVAADTEKTFDASTAHEVLQKRLTKRGDITVENAALFTIVGLELYRNSFAVQNQLRTAGFLSRGERHNWIPADHSVRFTAPARYQVATAAKIHAAIFNIRPNRHSADTVAIEMV